MGAGLTIVAEVHRGMPAHWTDEQRARRANEWAPGASHWTVTLRTERGEITTPYSMGASLQGPPDGADVLISLLSECPWDGATFEEWAADLGYDTDSRRAEREFRECCATRDLLAEVLGASYDELHSLDEDEIAEWWASYGSELHNVG